MLFKEMRILKESQKDPHAVTGVNYAFNKLNVNLKIKRIAVFALF